MKPDGNAFVVREFSSWRRAKCMRTNPNYGKRGGPRLKREYACHRARVTRARLPCDCASGWRWHGRGLHRRFEHTVCYEG